MGTAPNSGGRFGRNEFEVAAVKATGEGFSVYAFGFSGFELAIVGKCPFAEVGTDNIPILGLCTDFNLVVADSCVDEGNRDLAGEIRHFITDRSRACGLVGVEAIILIKGECIVGIIGAIPLFGSIRAFSDFELAGDFLHCYLQLAVDFGEVITFLIEFIPISPKDIYRVVAAAEVHHGLDVGVGVGVGVNVISVVGYENLVI